MVRTPGPPSLTMEDNAHLDESFRNTLEWPTRTQGGDNMHLIYQMLESQRKDSIDMREEMRLKD